MRIDNISFDIVHQAVLLEVPDLREAMRLKLSFKPGDYDLVPHKEKRSRNANSYAWELIGKIASATRLPPVDVYRNEIREISGKSEMLWCRSSAVEAFKESWTANHLGRFVDVIEDDGEDATLIATYGSSDYDKREMAMLIDNIIQDCLSLGIETKSKEEIDSLLESWNGR